MSLNAGWPRPVESVGNNPVPDNLPVARQIAKRVQVKGGGLGDYPNLISNRVLQTKSGAYVEPMGPSDTPVVVNNDPTTIEGWLKQIHEDLLRMPYRITQEWRTRFLQVPREAVPFIAASNSVTINAGASGQVVSITVARRNSGYITHLGVDVVPPAAFPTTTFDLRIGTAVTQSIIHPRVSAQLFNASTLDTPIPFPFEITQGKTIILTATNIGAAPVVVKGVIVGWTEYLSDNKTYGSAPTNGIG